MKIFLLIIVLICCILVAFKIKNYFKDRKVFFENLITFCQNIKNKISYQNEKLGLMIKDELNSNYDKGFLEFLKEFQKYINQDIDKNNLKIVLAKKLNFLKDNEIDALFNYILKIGNSFQEEEIEHIIYFEKWANHQLEKINSFNSRFASLYFKLFVILGILIFIIFI